MVDFAFNSRYRLVPQRTTTTPSGDTVAFVGRRIIPDLSAYTPLTRHRTVLNDRIDQVAAGGYGDPLLYWRITDANGDEDPLAACLPLGRLLIVPLPLGVSGVG
jgi:hypothetical protein